MPGTSNVIRMRPNGTPWKISQGRNWAAPGSMGKPMPGYVVDVVDEDGRRAPDDTVGNVAVAYEPDRPVGLFDEYYRDPEATARAFRDGWYYTGDKAWRDADGYLWFEGRDDVGEREPAFLVGVDGLHQHEIAPRDRPFGRVIRKFDEGRRRRSRRQMQIGHEPDAIAPRVRREHLTACLDGLREPAQPFHAERAGNVRLKHVEAIALQQLIELVALAGHFTAGDT